MGDEQTAQRRPFHESIIDAIKTASFMELPCLGRLIKATAIPKSHEEIAHAWATRSSEVGFVDGLNIPENLREQKEQVAEAKRAEEQESAETFGKTL